MEKNNLTIAIVVLWVICIGSLFGIHAYKNKKPKPSEYSLNARAVFRGMNDEEKTKLMHIDSGMLRLKDKSIHLVGSGYEAEEGQLLSEEIISIKHIDFRIDDIVLLERRMMFSIAYRTLNNAEKQCLKDGFATVVFRNGEYYYLFDRAKYKEYVLKYGTECKTCEELKKQKMEIK